MSLLTPNNCNLKYQNSIFKENLQYVFTYIIFTNKITSSKHLPDISKYLYQFHERYFYTNDFNRINVKIEHQIMPNL